MYAGVPTTLPARVSWASVASGARARPKSRTFTHRFGASSQMLPGLMSRWTSPASCAAASPSAISAPIRSTSATAGRRFARSAAASVCPVSRGMAMYDTPPPSPTR